MNCKGVIREISNYLDGDLDPQTKVDLEHHLEHCEDCRLVVDTTRKTVEVLCDSQPLALPKEVSSRLHQALAKRIREHRDA